MSSHQDLAIFCQKCGYSQELLFNWDQNSVPVLERCPSYRESTKRSNERQGATLGVPFSKVSVLYRLP